MIVASVLAEISGLSVEVVAVVVLVVVLMFRRELKDFLGRANRIKAAGFEMAAADVYLEDDAGRPLEEPPVLEEEVPASSQEPTADAEDDGPEQIEELRAMMESDDPETLSSGALKALFLEEDDLADQLMHRLRLVQSDLSELRKEEALWWYAKASVRNDPKGFSELKRLEDDEYAGAAARRFSALLQLEGGQPTLAAELLASSVENAPDEDERVMALALQSRALTQAGREVEARELLELELQGRNDSRLWQALADVYDAAGEQLLRSLALQQVLANDSRNNQVRFDAAYALSTANEGALRPAVIHHYLKVIEFNENADWAMNNLGVSYEEAGLPISSIASYEQAVEQGNTLSAANVARALLKAGFADEAAEKLAEASESKDPHENVTAISAQVLAQRRDEAERCEKLAKLGQLQSDFLVAYMRGRFRGADIDSLNGRWVHDTGERFELALLDGRLTAEWEHKGHKRKLEGPARGATARPTYSEMQYWTIRGERGEQGWAVKAREWWVLDEVKDGVAVMRDRTDGDGITFARYQRAAT